VSIILNLCVYVDLSSPFLFVFSDDRLTCHTKVDDVPGDAGDAYRWRKDYLGEIL